VSSRRILAIMGSGETAPTMVQTHRHLVAGLGGSARAVVIDTPYGFQENAPDLARRAVEYFRRSVEVDVEVAGLTRLDDRADPVERERGLRRVADADWVFAGPGSPTYALRQWRDTPLPGLLADKLTAGGVVTFASAAALTLGRATVPVYEIYKAGEEPRWEEGLGLLQGIGIDAVVIPHYDNAEGGHHDTRFCYLGERRLTAMEEALPDGCWVLGVDEHTALVIDLDAGVARVTGNGTVTLRMRGNSRMLPSGETIQLAELRDPWSGPAAPHTGVSDRTAGSTASTAAPTAPAGLEDEIDDAVASFDAALAAGRADDAVRAALALEEALHRWSVDTLQSDAADRARAALRSMISALGDAAVAGLRDPRDTAGPFVEAFLELRAMVRAEKRFDLSDAIRDALVGLGVEVRDGADGVTWILGD
jgi:cyanophycinase-like exopeptidase